MTKASITLTGQVKWWNFEKGFGFIISGGIDYFVHYKAIKKGSPGNKKKQLIDGQTVSFMPTMTAKGNQAEEVEVIEADGNI